MNKKVDKWIQKGRKNCAKGDHWFVLQFPDYQLCPICGCKKADDSDMLTEYNGYIVCEPKFESIVLKVEKFNNLRK